MSFRATVLALLMGTLLLGAGGFAAQAAAKTLSASEGVVAATLSYPDAAGESGTEALPGLKLEISRGGTQFYSQPVSSSHCVLGCGLESISGSPFEVKDLEGNGEAEPVLELNTGGAHCCTIVQVFSFDPGVMAYRIVERDFGDPGAVLADLAGDGRLEFRSADDRFAYEFASYAGSALPLQIWRFQEGRFLDVTRSFPSLITADAARWLKVFLANRRSGHGLGPIAAWAADEYLLDEPLLVGRRLAREARLHRLRDAEHVGVGGSAFVTKLERFLKKSGYIQLLP